MPTIQQLAQNVLNSTATLGTASTAKLGTNSALLSAESAYSLALTGLAQALQGGNQQQISAAAATVLTANSTLAQAQVADANATAAVTMAQVQLANDQQALNAAIVGLLTGGQG